MVPLQISTVQQPFNKKFQMFTWCFWYWPRRIALFANELIANAAGERGNASTTISVSWLIDVLYHLKEYMLRVRRLTFKKTLCDQSQLCNNFSAFAIASDHICNDFESLNLVLSAQQLNQGISISDRSWFITDHNHDICAALEKLITMSEIPAAVSTSKMSISSSREPNARIKPACWAYVKVQPRLKNSMSLELS